MAGGRPFPGLACGRPGRMRSPARSTSRPPGLAAPAESACGPPRPAILDLSFFEERAGHGDYRSSFFLELFAAIGHGDAESGDVERVAV